MNMITNIILFVLFCLTGIFYLYIAYCIIQSKYEIGEIYKIVKRLEDCAKGDKNE